MEAVRLRAPVRARSRQGARVSARTYHAGARAVLDPLVARKAGARVHGGGRGLLVGELGARAAIGRVATARVLRPQTVQDEAAQGGRRALGAAVARAPRRRPRQRQHVEVEVARRAARGSGRREARTDRDGRRARNRRHYAARGAGRPGGRRCVRVEESIPICCLRERQGAVLDRCNVLMQQKQFAFKKL